MTVKLIVQCKCSTNIVRHLHRTEINESETEQSNKRMKTMGAHLHPIKADI